ncbi:uncharacterized protein LOC144318122 isoform X2 [Canis aureus]
MLHEDRLLADSVHGSIPSTKDKACNMAVLENNIERHQQPDVHEKRHGFFTLIVAAPFLELDVTSIKTDQMAEGILEGSLLGKPHLNYSLLSTNIQYLRLTDYTH